MAPVLRPVDQLTGVLALIAANRFRLQRAELVQTQPPQNPADSGRRDADFGCNLLADPALAPQLLDLLNHRLRRRTAQPTRPRGTILQAGQSLVPISTYPFANCPRADAYGLADGLRRLPARLELHDPLSTARR